MHLFINAFIFYLGAIVGSFLNVCIHRLPRGESIVSPPSHCPHCKTPIKPYDNLPILSYLILRGRCRKCGERFSPRYLVVELLTAASFLLIFLLYLSNIPLMIVYIAFVSSLIVVFFADLEHQIIPNEISVGGIVFGLAASIAYPPLHFTPSHSIAILRSVTGLVVGGGVFWLIRILGRRVFKKEAMGFGDVKLMAYIGALLGWKIVLLTTFFASLLGSMVGLSLIVTGKAELGSRLPFGPYLCVGAVTSFLFGNQLVSWYLSLL